ncbi:Os08g0197400, partial [Oryza sativa Japonica Group]
DVFESGNGGWRLLRTSSTRRRAQPVRRNAREERHARAAAPWRGGDVPAWRGKRRRRQWRGRRG